MYMYILSLSNTRMHYKNGLYEGFQEQMVTICDPREGSHALVMMHPLNQHARVLLQLYEQKLCDDRRS